MKTAIVYAPGHKSFTTRLMETIRNNFYNVTMIDATKAKMINLTNYDMIGFASSVHFNRFNKCVREFMSDNLDSHKEIFLMYTGKKNQKCTSELRKLAESRKCTVKGEFCVQSGILPSNTDVDSFEGAVAFIRSILS